MIHYEYRLFYFIGLLIPFLTILFFVLAPRQGSELRDGEEEEEIVNRAGDKNKKVRDPCDFA